MLDRYDLEAELRRRGVAKAAIARRLGFTQRYVGMVLEGIRRNAAIERALASALDMPVSRLRRIVRAPDSQAIAA